ncbi:MAG: DUF4124 domain-containing protein [Deltaproteobacteria bacterium]|nr:DUF4124 domain-containing protein [Deltaproteobacteria bacterium]
MKRFSLIVFLMLFSIPAISNGELYKWVDQDGVKHYSTTPPPQQYRPPLSRDCKQHIELHSAQYLARALGKSETWVVANYRITLWQKETPKDKGRKVGEMLPGSRAVILRTGPDDYKVKSPLDGSVGWVNKTQVNRVLLQNIKTRRPCD